tara:strand:- start:37886 stop:38068 length:183 start_codon:yes stop_codon:yes gene_type:complete
MRIKRKSIHGKRLSKTIVSKLMASTKKPDVPIRIKSGPVSVTIKKRGNSLGSTPQLQKEI